MLAMLKRAAARVSLAVFGTEPSPSEFGRPGACRQSAVRAYEAQERRMEAEGGNAEEAPARP
jgi:hypothetical protein